MYPVLLKKSTQSWKRHSYLDPFWHKLGSISIPLMNKELYWIRICWYRSRTPVWKYCTISNGASNSNFLGTQASTISWLTLEVIPQESEKFSKSSSCKPFPSSHVALSGTPNPNKQKFLPNEQFGKCPKVRPSRLRTTIVLHFWPSCSYDCISALNPFLTGN